MKTLKDKIENMMLTLCALSRDVTDVDGMKFVNATEKVEEDVKQAIKDDMKALLDCMVNGVINLEKYLKKRDKIMGVWEE